MVDWITGTITSAGYLGIVLLMLAENLFPPIPSELIMPFAGFVAARGDLHVAGVVAAGVAGSLLGALPWYLAGRWIGKERLQRVADRYGRWLTVSRADLEHAEAWFARYGRLAVFLGRLVPAVRTLISVPAGLSGMPPLSFFAWSCLGTLLWTGFLTGAGYVLEAHYEVVAGWIDVATKMVLGVVGLAYVYRLMRRSR
jgi:membrane protein DedA with SNARE-associated domain